MKHITLDRVWKRFDSKAAVADLSFDIPAGKVFGLLGPNGAGKTTLIRMLMDIIKPDSGSILYDGLPLTADAKDHLTYLPEERGLYRKEKIRDLLRYFAMLKGLSAEDARHRSLRILEKLEMAELPNQKVEELSKGNQQKIQIAAALVSDPEIIILDEPFAGLDPLNVRVAKNLLAEQKRLGKTILLSTHQMNQVEELCDELMMIHNGKQVLYGPVAEILDSYSEPALLLESGEIPADVPGVERVEGEGRYRKLYIRPDTAPSSVLKALIERGVPIERFQKATTPLEDVFVRVVRESSERKQK